LSENIILNFEPHILQFLYTERRKSILMGITTKYVTIGIAGHVDHGKTSLVKSLTGIDTDRLKEEKDRGLSIESGVAVYTSQNNTSISLVDVPGHTDYMKNTIRGLSSVDFGILVVAANDGVMPQTLEHVQIMEFHGVTEGFIVLSKSDLVDHEILELAELEIRDALKSTFLKDKEILVCSNVNQKGIPEINTAITRIAEKLPLKDHSGSFRMWIDRIIDSRGFGTVVSGTILSGRLKKDDPVVLMPGGIETRARVIESHHKIIDEAYAGQRVGVNLHKISMNDVKRGMVIAAADSLRPCFMLNSRLRLLKNKNKTIHNRDKVKLYTGTSLVNATVLLIENDILRSGEEGFVQLRLSDPIAVTPGDKYIIAQMNLPNILGGGRVIEITGKKYRKSIKDDIVCSLEALMNGNTSGYIDIKTKGTNGSLVMAVDLSKNTCLPPEDVTKEIGKRVKSGEFMDFGAKGIIRSEIFKKVKSDIPEILRSIQRGTPMKLNIKPEEIKTKISFAIPITSLEKILDQLFNEGVLEKKDGGYLLNGFSPSMTEDQNFAVSLIIDFVAESGLAPFSVDTVWKKYNRKYPKIKLWKVISFLRSRKRLIQVKDGRFLSFEAIEQIKEKIVKVIEDKEIFTLLDCKPVFGYGRTGATSVLDYLDEQGFTERVEEGRVLKEKKDELNMEQ
jgi:selenocysteine-specific elongation factor